MFNTTNKIETVFLNQIIPNYSTICYGSFTEIFNDTSDETLYKAYVRWCDELSTKPPHIPNREHIIDVVDN